MNKIAPPLNLQSFNTFDLNSISSDDVSLPILDRNTLPANPFKLKMVRRRMFSANPDLTDFITKNKRITNDSDDHVPTTPINNVSLIEIGQSDGKVNQFQIRHQCKNEQNDVGDDMFNEIPEGVLFPDLNEAIEFTGEKKDMKISLRKKRRLFQ